MYTNKRILKTITNFTGPLKSYSASDEIRGGC